MKIIFIIIDGLADKPLRALGNRTPLEAAETLNLDWLAKNGVCGWFTPFQFPRQKEPQSDSSHLALFGYPPEIYYLGRGVYEVSGINMELKEKDLALRVNFAAVDEHLKIVDRRAGRIEQSGPLVKALNGKQVGGIRCLLKASYGHRAGLILRGRGLSNRISDGDPDKTDVIVNKIIPADNSKTAEFTADVLNKFLERAHLILQEHPLNKRRIKQGFLPANYLLVRGAGFFRKTPSFEKRYGLKACAIAGGALYKGIARILGMDLIEDECFTGKSNTNIKAKVGAAEKALKQGKAGAGYDFCYLHIKAADTFGHDGDFRGKADFIEQIDKALPPLLKLKDIIVVTGDHATCSKLKRHCQAPVPVLIYGGGADKVKEFSEKACQKGGLGKLKASELMPIIIKLKTQMSKVKAATRNEKL